MPIGVFGTLTNLTVEYEKNKLLHNEEQVSFTGNMKLSKCKIRDCFLLDPPIVSWLEIEITTDRITNATRLFVESHNLIS